MYKQSFVGILWAIILPLASVGTFVMLNSSGVFSINDTHAPYAIYAMLGWPSGSVFRQAWLQVRILWLVQAP